ncbi:MAG: Type-1 restriction enzyme EcoKI specificity protein [Syntrophorhabdaceae bacterium]|nr:Type-1 restriction enzyme EcoKI specificity protein [Syntrophorhabdaceae bacterium]
MNTKLPTGWEFAQLQKIVEHKKGKKPKHLTEAPTKGYIPYIDIKAFEKKEIDRYADPSSSNLATEKDILVVWDGARSGLVGLGMVGAIGSTILALKPLIISPKYLFRYLQTQYEHINSNPRGTGIPHVDPEIFWSIQIPLAPFNEQRRIVAKLDELLSKVDACKARLDKIPAILKRFRQSVLAAACSGRLTADWREQNGNTEIFEQTTVEAVADFVGGFAYKSPKFLKVGRHQVVRIGNVRPFVPNLMASPVFIPDEIAEQTERFRLLPNDIIISMTGTKYKKDYGYAAIVEEFDRNLFLNQRVARLRCRDKILPKFLLYWLQSDAFREFFFAGETGNVNQGNVGADGIRKAPIELPPLSEQKEIVRRVEALFKLADQIEKRYQKAKAHVDKLTQSILAKAFRGELVPQDPNDEPAAKLLERIRAEREKQERIANMRNVTPANAGVSAKRA